MSNRLIKPANLQKLLEQLVDFYSDDISKGNTDNPHYEHREIDGTIYKIGYLPEPNKKDFIIRIVEKGNNKL